MSYIVLSRVVGRPGSRHFPDVRLRQQYDLGHAVEHFVLKSTHRHAPRLLIAHRKLRVCSVECSPQETPRALERLLNYCVHSLSQFIITKYCQVYCQFCGNHPKSRLRNEPVLSFGASQRFVHKSDCPAHNASEQSLIYSC